MKKLISLFVASVLLAACVDGNLSKLEFMEYLGKQCFRDNDNGQPMVNGQDNPLPQTMESFIALAEKLEVENPGLKLRDELYYFIREFSYNDIEFAATGDVTRFQFSDWSRELAETLWELDSARREGQPDNIKDPFTDDEKCALFNAISHSIILKFEEKKERFFSPTNRSHTPVAYNIHEYYPSEMGVVSVRGSTRAVALGRVLLGMYVGLSNNRQRPVEEIRSLSAAQFKYLPQMKIVDTLYQVTMAEVISLATWSTMLFKRDRFAQDGIWSGPPAVLGLDRRDICPTHYLLPRDTNATQSYSTLRGAADGLILGELADELGRDARLSQVLRQYYSQGGFSHKGQYMGYCNRYNWMETLKTLIEQQVLLYQFLAGNSFTTAEVDATFSMSRYQENAAQALGVAGTDMQDYCSRVLSTDDANPKSIQELPLESPLDVIVVLDSNYGDEAFKTQQRITGHLAKRMKLKYSGSRMTILLDRKVRGSSGSGATVNLQEIVEDTYSAGCAACSVTQIAYDEVVNQNEEAPEDEVIIAIDQLLVAKKEKEAKYSGVNGKIIVYFNFQEESRSSRPDVNEARVNKALQDLHRRHRDVTIIALGRTPELVKKYTRFDSTYVLSAVDEPEEKVAHHLLGKIAKEPSILQYTDCEQGRSESSAVYEDYVSRNKIQHWEMPAQYMYKSLGFKFTFETGSSSPIKVCYNRATNSPELEAKTCQQGTKIEVHDANPCKSFTKETCSPLYFAVLGVNSTEDSGRNVCVDNIQAENRCSTLDQIRFRVSHEGIRCSGSLAILSAPFLIAICALFLQILFKMH